MADRSGAARVPDRPALEPYTPNGGDLLAAAGASSMAVPGPGSSGRCGSATTLATGAGITTGRTGAAGGGSGASGGALAAGRARGRMSRGVSALGSICLGRGRGRRRHLRQHRSYLDCRGDRRLHPLGLVLQHRRRGDAGRESSRRRYQAVRSPAKSATSARRRCRPPPRPGRAAPAPHARSIRAPCRHPYSLPLPAPPSAGTGAASPYP